jgi:four helix bundle protein
MGSYKELFAWQKAMDVVTEIYRVTRGFPKEEIFGLTSQMRRAAVSIASNIAEGHGRISANDRKYFVAMARGSLLEVETQLQIAVNLTYVDAVQAKPLFAAMSELGKIINGLLKSIR